MTQWSVLNRKKFILAHIYVEHVHSRTKVKMRRWRLLFDKSGEDKHTHSWATIPILECTHFLSTQKAESDGTVEFGKKSFLNKKLAIRCSFLCWFRISDLFCMKIKFSWSKSSCAKAFWRMMQNISIHLKTMSALMARLDVVFDGL